MKTSTKPATSAKSRPLRTTEQLAFLVEHAMKMDGFSVNRLAEKANVCFATVDRLIDRVTKFPRLDTVIKILTALDYEVTVSKKREVGVRDVA